MSHCMGLKFKEKKVHSFFTNLTKLKHRLESVINHVGRPKCWQRKENSDRDLFLSRGLKGTLAPAIQCRNESF
jgi:hypothetical protein